MNKGHFKDSQVVKGITIGAVLIVIYLALNNVTGILILYHILQDL